MVWKIELERSAEKELDQLDGQIARRLLKFIFQRLAFLENPRSIGESLTGPRFGELWKYRVETTASSPGLKMTWSVSSLSASATAAMSIVDLLSPI